MQKTDNQTSLAPPFTQTGSPVSQRGGPIPHVGMVPYGQNGARNAYPDGYSFPGQGPQVFNRPPRIWASTTEETITVPALPKREEIPQKPMLLTLLMPVMMMGIVFMMYVVLYHGSTQQLIFLMPMLLFSVMTPVSTLVGTYQKRKAVRQAWRVGNKRYRAVLAKLQEQLKVLADEQRAAALVTDPDPGMLERRIRERSHLWERRVEDPDFLAVRVGRGKRPSSVTLKIPEMELSDSLFKDVQQLKEDFAFVDDIPCAISLTKVKSLGITGRRQDVAALTHTLLCQLATHHSPEDVRILPIYPQSQRIGWDWLAELPHTKPLKASKLERLVAVGQEEAQQLLDVLLEELSQRASKDGDNAGGPPAAGWQQGMPSPLPHLVVVVHDYVEVRKHPALANAFKLGEQLGISVIYLVAQEQAIPGECRGVVRLSEEGDLSFAAAGFAGETLEGVKLDIIDPETPGRIAHALAPLQVVNEGEDAGDLPTNVRLLDLLELRFADEVDLDSWWNSPPFGRLRVPLGQGASGTVWIDLNDAAHGPHGIIAGTTGAGKSELLQSLIIGLAMTHHPHLVNFVLVDFKGGAAFKAFERMPHTVGMVTDLSGRLTERALTALKSELRRREHMLGGAGAKNIKQYQAMRANNAAAMEPMPNLFIVIDEFAELAKEHPTFMEGLVSVVQKGRSLGVHLILATQKPTGSVNANIWSNLKFRICLRVASLQDSRDMLGRSEAALLPSTIPGRAYFQIGEEVFELFQSARISLPARVGGRHPAPAAGSQEGEEITDQHVLLGLIEPYQKTIGAELFRPWPDPLPQRVGLPEIFQRQDMPASAETGQGHASSLNETEVALAQGYTLPASIPPEVVNSLSTERLLPMEAKNQQGTSGQLDIYEEQPPFGWVTFPIGLVDLPAEQRQEPLLLDLPRTGGHVLVAGASGTGKSMFLRTLITSLVQTHTPGQLHLYLVDFGGQTLRAFEKLPHVGGVFGEADEDYIRRVLRKLQGIIEERKHVCMTHQIEDFLTYQRRRSEDRTLPGMPAVLLVIDKFVEFRQAHEKEMDMLLSIVRHGRGYGVYVVLTIDRPTALPMQFMSLIELRIGLRLVELTDSLILLGKNDAAHLDGGMPGRGYIRGGRQRAAQLMEVQIALPVSGDDDDEQAHQIEELVTRQAQDAEGLIAPPIQLMPEYLRIDDFLIEAAFSGPLAQAKGAVKRASAIRLRVGIEDLSLQPIALELNADMPHVLVGGGPGSGRTGVLQTCLLVLASAPANRSARVVLVDFRRSSRLMRRLPNVWMYADTEDRLVETIEKLKTELRERVVRLREELEKNEDDAEVLLGLDMPPILLVIDDYDQLSALSMNPLNSLKEFMLQARDLHLHIIVAGMPNDLARSDVLLQQVRTCRVGIVLGGDPADQSLLGVRMSDLPPGRGYLVKRNQRFLVQIAHLEPDEMVPWVVRLGGWDKK